ncbi:uncharacterized protein JCM15063_001927 [Sporobolomyces koalae]|uniref:uncharacterized protein n=1 Tax=Sporobolomyces koalae TaxID=500713 RepID=UPI0031737DB0
MASFEQAVEWIAASGVPTTTQIKLKLYSLYKMATVSIRPATSRPGMLDFRGRAKWDAWDNLGKTSGFDAQQAKLGYIEQARALGWSPTDEAPTPIPADKHKKEQAVSVSQIQTDFVDEAPPSRLHDLALEGDAQALEAFLKTSQGSASQIDERDSYGYSALHLATDRGHLDSVKVLLAHGADKTATDEDGNTALGLARLADHEDLVSLLSAA